MSESTNSGGQEQRDRYELGRDFNASIRLNLQHYLFREVFGTNLSPHVVPTNTSNLRIADIGTGTAIWLADVKKQYPSAQLDGFDISLNQAPAPQWMIPGTSVSRLDMFEPIPEELKGRYDIVNVRMFVMVLKNVDPRPFITKLSELLKPGGWLNWTEHTLPHLAIHKAEPSLPSAALEKLSSMLHVKGISDWCLQIPTWLTSANFHQTALQQHDIPPHLWQCIMHLLFQALTEYSFVALDNEAPDSEGCVLRNLLGRCAEEVRRGVALEVKPVVVTARKAVGGEEEGG